MNPLFKFFLFLYNDIKEDIKTIFYIFRQIKNDKPILNPDKKKMAIEQLKTIPKDLFKESWYWVLAIIFVFAMGSLIGFEYCETKCNNFIYDNYGDVIIDRLNLTVISPNISAFNSEISYNDSYNKDYSKDSQPNPTWKTIP